MERGGASCDAGDPYAAVAGEDGPSPGTGWLTRGERGGVRMSSQVRPMPVSSWRVFLSLASGISDRPPRIFAMAAGAESFAWRRAGRFEPATAGAGAALFLYHRYFLAGTARPASDLAGFFPCIRKARDVARWPLH